ncbi:MAG: ribonuclease D [Deltaproteobacteria bacterium]|nr:ribonuclease D [Deltaproteobacteria bacterium]
MTQPHENLSLVDTEAALTALIAELASAPLLAFDTEFHSERTYTPRLMLLQVAIPGKIWLVDPLALSLEPLVVEMARPGRTVIGHALRNDLRILWQVYGLGLIEVFDTQVAAAFLGHGLQVGLGHLLQRVLHLHLPKGEQMANWGQRPLPDKLKIYAAGDVEHLFALHAALRDELVALERLDWVQAECAGLCSTGQYVRDPALAGERLAGAKRLEPREAGVVYALAALREKMAQDEDVVPHFLLPDDVLMTLAKLAPKHARDIHGDRRLQQRVVQRFAQAWVDAVAAGLQQPVYRAPGRPPPPPELDAVATLGMLLVGELAQKHRIAAPLLAKRDVLLDALREQPDSLEAFCDHAALSGWRRQLVGEPLWRFVRGDQDVRCVADAETGFRLKFSDLEEDAPA